MPGSPKPPLSDGVPPCSAELTRFAKKILVFKPSETRFVVDATNYS
jgi:hypothetical protein